MKSVFESEKINYIHVSLDLIDDYLIMVNDREIQKCISTKIRVYSREDEVNWVKAKLEEGAQVFSMISKEDGSYIGNVELMDIENGSAEVGLCITMAMQNKHYGTEALKRIIEYGFKELDLNTLTAVIFSNNVRSLHNVEKLGFKKCGIEKNVKVEDGVSVDDVHFILER
ncbi:MAG: GNAT family N-acetyltransferase [Tenericutes bacterium]|nr:GNAT family N-acetyltransferase [Mycoplasmatota bacterium]